MLHPDPPLVQHRDIGRRAAHVEHDDVVVAGELRAPDAAQRTAGGARHQQADRLLDRRTHARDAACRLHQQEFPAEAGGLERVGELRQIVRDLGPDERVQRGRREPLVFAKLRQHLRAQRDVHPRIFLLDDPLHDLFVRGIEEREQEADRDGLDAVLLELSDRAPDFVLVDRMQHFAVRRDQALLDRQAMTPLDHRIFLPGNVLRDAEIQRPLVATDMDDVAEALGGHHAGLDPGVLQHEVGRDRRAVKQVVDRIERRPRLGTKMGHAVHHADGRVRRRRRRLVDRDAAFDFIDKDEIREGPTDIDADSLHGPCSSRWPFAR